MSQQFKPCDETAGQVAISQLPPKVRGYVEQLRGSAEVWECWEFGADGALWQVERSTDETGVVEIAAKEIIYRERATTPDSTPPDQPAVSSKTHGGEHASE